MIDFFCRVQSEFFRTSTAPSEKFNHDFNHDFRHDFNHENRHSGTGYIETAVFVPYRFQSRFQSQFQTRFQSRFSAHCRTISFTATARLLASVDRVSWLRWRHKMIGTINDNGIDWQMFTKHFWNDLSVLLGEMERQQSMPM